MLIVLLVVLCAIFGMPSCEAGIPFLSWLIDWEVVCEPDFRECLHGGLSFRDRKHHCEFTPCDLIPAPPSRPPPPDPKTLPAIHWFGVEEFVVPALDVAAVTRGKALETRWVDSIMAKLRRLSHASPVVLDVYLVPRSPQELPYEAHALYQHLGSLLASEPGLQLSKGQATHTPSLTVAHLPWTRWQFFGQFALQPMSVDHVQAALQLLQRHIKAQTNSTSTGFASLVLEEQSEDIAMGDILVHCEGLLDKKGLVEYGLHQPHIMTAHPRDVSKSLSALVYLTKVPHLVSEQTADTNTELSLSLTSCPNVSLDSNTSRPTVSISILPLPAPQLFIRPLHAGNATEPPPTKWRCSCWRRSTPPTDPHTPAWVVCRQ